MHNVGGEEIVILNNRCHHIAWMAVVLCSGIVTSGAPLTTAFTYQGQLKSDGAPLDDTCDFLFSIWTASQDGVQVGSAASAPGIGVVNGLFQAQVDVGVEAFSGEEIWLQVALRCPSGAGAFTTLAQRQPVTAAPFALHTRGIVVDSAGNLGIGTQFPANKLTVRSADVSTFRLIGPTGTYGYGDRLNFGDGEFAFIEEDLDDQLQFYAGRFAFSNGRVGVGTLAPQARLDVASASETAVRAVTDSVGLHGVHQGGSGTFPGVWGETDSTSGGGSGVRGYATATTGGAYGVLGKSSSQAGVGVYSENTSGGTALAAVGNGSFRQQATLRVENTQPTAGMAAFIKSQGSWATMHVENDSTGEVLWLQRDNSNGPFIVAHNADTAQHVFSVSQNGYTKVAVLEITGGADFSEGFEIVSVPPESPQEGINVPITPQPGMVVSIDATNPGKLVVSDKPYDKAVAGIISGAGGVKPGMVMAQAASPAAGNVPVALSGRVFCLCDASKEPIRPGDLLTTSARPGHAQKAVDRDRVPGAVIGKAMSSLDGGTGLVLVLVSLQ